MFDLYNTYKKEHPRLTNNIILSVVSLIGCLVAVILASPTQPLLEALAVGTGYVGLGLLALTLLIGPLNMLKVRKNPVNLNFRRDAGIWAGILSLLHVLLVFALEIDWGGSLLGYFLYKNGSIKLNLFGISNYIGLFATLILIFLMVLSNNHFLKALKGKKWKNLQRFNYLLFALVLGHTFTQQVNNVRGLWMVIGALIVTAAVLVGQAIGFRIYRKREQHRKVAPVGKSAPTRAAASTAPVQLAPATKVAAPVQTIPATGGFSKLKVASAVSLLAMLGIGAGLEGINLLNTPVTAQTGSLASDETPAGDTGSGSAATTPAATETTAATATATAAATTSTATTSAATTASSTPTATTTTAPTTTAAATTAAATTAATTTAAATMTATSSSTTVSSASKSSGSTHTGGS